MWTQVSVSFAVTRMSLGAKKNTASGFINWVQSLNLFRLHIIFACYKSSKSLAVCMWPSSAVNHAHFLQATCFAYHTPAAFSHVSDAFCPIRSNSFVLRATHDLLHCVFCIALSVLTHRNRYIDVCAKSFSNIQIGNRIWFGEHTDLAVIAMHSVIVFCWVVENPFCVLVM